MKIVHLEAHAREGKTRVRGLIHSDSGHLLPVNYHVEHDADASVHERHVTEYHAKSEVWTAIRPAIHALVGAYDGFEIIEAAVGLVSHSDWQLRVIWDDSSGHRHCHFKSYHHPEMIPPPDKILAMVTAQASLVAPKEAHLAHIEALATLKGKFS